jgi:AcrR family transcriptional regulator
VVTRAGMAESALREVFPTVEECYRAAFDEGLSRLSRTVSDATAREEAWLERVRSGLVAFLGFFDDEPSWARLLMLDTPLSAVVTFECRQRLHDLLARLLEPSADVGERRAAGAAAASPLLLATLTGELVVGGVLSVIRTSMFEHRDSKLVELAPSLMAFIVAPYLGQAAAKAELEGRPSAAKAELERRPSATAELVARRPGPAREQAISRAAELPVRATRRTTMVLQAIARAPYSNNREVAQAAGLTDEGQASKLLARLEHKGVIENVGVGAARGEPNAWLLTASGRRAVELLGEGLASDSPTGRIRTRGGV